MRKVFIASVGTLLVLFLATSGYPAQGAVAVQGSGDVTLHFGIQHEFDFEVRDNYDLDNGLTDGCGDLDCSGERSSVDGFFTNEARLIVQGSQGDIWKARLTLESPEPIGGNDEQPAIDVERAWVDIKLYDTPVHVKIGMPLWDQLDPFRLVWSDDEAAVKIYATHGNISWAVWWVKENDVASAKGTSGGRDGDQDYYMARVDLDFGSFQVSPTIAFLRNKSTTTDKRIARGFNRFEGTGAAAASAFKSGARDHNSDGFKQGVTVDENVWYPGVTAKGTFGPVSFVGEFFAALGEIGDDSAQDAQREQDVSAYMFAVDVGVKLGAWTPHAGIIFMSGDSNPHDSDAEGWAPIGSDNENLLGQRGILMDDGIAVLNLADDSITAEGVNSTFREFGLNPGMIAAFVGLKGRPTKKIKTDLNLIYYQWDKERQWEYYDGIVSRINCVPTEISSGEGICSNGFFTTGDIPRASSAQTTLFHPGGEPPEEFSQAGLVETMDDEVGWELNGAVTYAYNKHVSLTISAAVFWPGDGAEILAQCVNASDGNIVTSLDILTPVPPGVFNPLKIGFNDETVRGTFECDPRHAAAVKVLGEKVILTNDTGGAFTAPLLDLSVPDRRAIRQAFRSIPNHTVPVTNERADDEAFNIEVELMVTF